LERNNLLTSSLFGNQARLNEFTNYFNGYISGTSSGKKSIDFKNDINIFNTIYNKDISTDNSIIRIAFETRNTNPKGNIQTQFSLAPLYNNVLILAEAFILFKNIFLSHDFLNSLQNEVPQNELTAIAINSPSNTSTYFTNWISNSKDFFSSHFLIDIEQLRLIQSDVDKYNFLKQKFAEKDWSRSFCVFANNFYSNIADITFNDNGDLSSSYIEVGDGSNKISISYQDFANALLS